MCARGPHSLLILWRLHRFLGEVFFCGEVVEYRSVVLLIVLATHFVIIIKILSFNRFFITFVKILT